MTTEELIEALETRIKNCEKRIEEINNNPSYVMLGGALTSNGIYWVRYWKGKLDGYKAGLKDLKVEVK